MNWMIVSSCNVLKLLHDDLMKRLTEVFMYRLKHDLAPEAVLHHVEAKQKMQQMLEVFAVLAVNIRTYTKQANINCVAYKA